MGNNEESKYLREFLVLSAMIDESKKELSIFTGDTHKKNDLLARIVKLVGALIQNKLHEIKQNLRSLGITATYIDQGNDTIQVIILKKGKKSSYEIKRSILNKYVSQRATELGLEIEKMPVPTGSTKFGLLEGDPYA